VNRSIALTILTTLLMTPPVAQARLETRREQSAQTVDPRGLKQLVVENSRGDIQVRPSTDGALHVTALKIIPASGRSWSERLARGTQVETRNEAGRYRIHVVYPPHAQIRLGFWDLFRGDLEMRRPEIRLSVDVPQGLPVDLQTRSGDVESVGLTGTQNIETTSGDIDIQDARGQAVISTSSGSVTASGLGMARVRSSSGDISIDGVSGPLQALTSSGDLVVGGARDSLVLRTSSGDVRVGPAPRGLRLETGSGDVQIEGCAGNLKVTTTSGDVSAGLLSGLATAEISTESGSVRTRLGSTLGSALDLQTSSGTLDVALPIQVRIATRRHLSGIVRDGRAPITVRTTSGDIDVLRGGN
jgi:hypothetical protein